jgi:hypothetical protein
MKSNPLSFSKFNEPSIHFTIDSAEAIERSIMRLIEENATLRLLAAQLGSELGLARSREALRRGEVRFSRISSSASAVSAADAPTAFRASVRRLRLV